MPLARPRVLLVGVFREVAHLLHTALDRWADVLEVSVDTALAIAGNRREGHHNPMVVVIGQELPAPFGLVNALRPDGLRVAAVVVTTPSTAAKLATLPLLFSTDQVRRVPAAEIDRLPELVQQMLRTMIHRTSYVAMRTAAQRQLTSGVAISRQLGEQLFGQFLAQAPVGAVMLDGRGGMAAWNQETAEILGLTEPGSIGQPLVGLFPPSEQDRLRKHLVHPRDIETTFERIGAQGALQDLRLTPQQVLDVDGIERTLILVEDVTDRVQAQRQLTERTNHALLSADVAAAMTHPGAFADRLHQCARAIVNHLNATCVRIWVAQSPDGSLATMASTAVSPEDDDLLIRMSRDGSVIDKIAGELRPYLDVLPAADSGASQARPAVFAGYPLVYAGELLGVLALTAPQLPQSTLVVLEGIADQIAIGIQQDRLLRRLHNTAEALQRPLMPPHLPDLPGFDLAARYRPYGGGEYIGGDFYDAFTVPDGRHVLVLGDVCGKGPAAAAVTGLVRHTLWAAAQHSPEPDHVLPLVNKALRREGSPFCTLTYVLLDPEPTPARMYLASAGHPAPVLRHRGGVAAPLPVGGPLLGVFENVTHPVMTVNLHPGETLVLYTDGFIEGSRDDDPREPQGFAASIARHPIRSSRPADELAGALLADAHQWGGEHLRDDLAVLVLTALPGGS
ncbi:MAG TPA: SpoIIE family protein phosphatase [Pseudonocardiaceae bacterium]